ncbi:carbon-nitrogen hydrolase family protein [Bifidobacterium sp. BRDM6]|uniref:Carbon-nitrogen hydrolase family protein n=2 Tax=Bifidobacterium choloepi TaxID=2614131 RepID=A0A6I5MXA2_9BIFI|nr:carbon-nitrogen hydrolase family protein [Bifidobacterium choloepi]
MNLRIALLQLLPERDTAANLAKGIAACRAAGEQGADIALFPEMWSSGYRIPEDSDELKALAVDGHGAFVQAFADLARELDMAIAITFLERRDPLPRNTVVLFDRHGSEALRYAKVHTCDFSDEIRLSLGDRFYVADLDTRLGTVRVGSMICFDREFPESARLLMLQGAEVILAPNACPMEINRLSCLRTRAYENMVAIATCNYPASHPDCNGHSTIFDGVAWLDEEPWSRDMCVLEAPEDEGIHIGSVDLAMLRAYRAHEVMGNAYRHPRCYGALMDTAVHSPFIRPDARR